MDCPFEFDECGMEIDDSKNGENSHPNISNADDTIRKRDQDLRGMAFWFIGKCTGWSVSESSQHNLINEFIMKIGDSLLATKQAQDHLNSITYVVLSCKIGGLSSSAETCDIPVIGYIQSSKQVRAKTLKAWMRNELEWQLVPGGLCGSTAFAREIQNSSEKKVKCTVYGQLGMNNCGSKTVILNHFLMLTSPI